MNAALKPLLAAMLATVMTQPYAATTTNNIAIDPAERAKIEEVVHAYLVQKPEVIVEAMQTLQRKQYEEAQLTVKKTQQDATKYADALFHQANDPSVGNSNAQVTIVEFFDYQCPHCIEMAPVTETIIKTNPNIRIVFKEFPIRGPVSELAARAALAANLQGKYYPFRHALLTATPPLTQDAIFKIAQETGLNVDKLKKDMNDAKISNQLQANVKLAQDLKLFGTPAFFIAKSDVSNNKGTISYIPGRMDQQQLQAEIDKAK